MRHIKKLLVLFLVFSAITSCEKEEVSYALQDISAPTDVKAIFDISQDEVGLVTLTPTAEGASMFEVYFGDVENETPTMVNPGETLSHTYAEGEYNLRIVAIGLTGLKSELIRVVTVSFDPPTDLEVEVKISSTNPFELLVTPSATNATVYDVYFGDVEDEEPLTIMDTETASHVYAETGTYNVRVVARGGGAASVEYTEEVTISGASEPVKLPITFEDATVNYAVAGFGASDFGPIPAAVIDNPDASGINTSTKVLSVNKLQDAQVWAGASIPLADAIDFSNSTTVAIKVWSPRAGTPILFKIEDSNSERDGNGNPTVFVEIQSSTTLVGTWEEITFDLSSIDSFDAANSYDTAIVFPDFGTAGKGELFYFDDIMLVGATSDCVAETEENIDFANGPINWTFKTDDADHEFDQFGDLSTDIVANPVTNGINTSCSVQMVKKTEGCATWSGLGTAIPTAIDFASTDKKVFKLKVMAKDQLAGVTLRLEKEPYPDVEPAEERVAQITELGVWQELTFDFSDVTDKSFRSIIIYFERDIACDGDVYYFDDLKQTDGGSGGGSENTTGQVSDDFDANRNIDTWFGDAAGMDDAFANPFKTGINTSNTVLEYKDEGGQYANVRFDVDPNFDLTESAKFSLKIYVPSSSITGSQNNQISLKLQDGTVSEPWAQQTEIIKPIELDKWQIVTFDFANDNTTGAADPVSRTDFNRVVLQVNGENNNDYVTAYIDDFIYGANAATGSTGGGNETASGEVAENGGFETGNLDGWAVYKNGGSIDADNTQSNSGDWSAKIVATSPNGLNPTLKQERKAAGSVAVGDVVQITFDYKGSSTGGGAYNMQSFVEAADGVNQTEVFSVTPTDAWQTFTTTYTVNSGDVSGGVTMEFTAICGDNSSCNSTLVLDNVSIILNP